MKYNVIKNGDRDENFSLIRDGTARDIIDMLNKHEIALMVRPTGFGKTYTMIRLCELAKYKKVIYLYPTDIIKQSVIDDYHDSYLVPVEQGSHKTKRVHGTSWRKFNMTESEKLDDPTLPYLIFSSYSKMLRDWNNAYKYSDEYKALSESEQQNFIKSWKENSNPESKLNMQKQFLQKRFSDVDLLIVDEAHMVGAAGFMSYWPYLRQMFLDKKVLKDSRLHVVGATATPLRTKVDINIEEEVFYYMLKDRKISARIKDFTIIDCWDANILPRPFYTKGLLDKESELTRLDDILQKSLMSYNEIGYNSKNSSKTSIINSYTMQKEEDFKHESALLHSDMDKIASPEEVVLNGIGHVNRDGLASKEYMRFLVFYQNTKDMIKWHDRINSIFNQIFIDGVDSSDELGKFSGITGGYKAVNTYYLVSNKELLGNNQIHANSISEISDRTEYLEKIKYARPEVDVIHCIDMLNMGYHVGKVTGVILKRSTGSEIKYYQQIGRCMSVRSNKTPLIVDFDNADAALFKRTQDSLRNEATDRIKEFVSNCIQSDDANALNKVYERVRLSVSMEELPEDLIEYYYFDRNAPIYFIRGIGKALKCDEGVDSIIEKLFNIAYSSRKYSVNDIVSDNYIKSEARVNKKIKDVTIVQIEKAVERIRTERGMREDA